MNLEKLVSNLQEKEKELEGQISPYCNPQQIANEIMSNLEKATPLTKSWTTPAGHHGEVGSLFTQYELWYINKPNKWNKEDKGLIRGPLSNCSDKGRLSQVVLDLVKKYITEDIIKLDLDGCDDDYGSMMYIMAIISRTDVENLKKRIGVEKKDLFDW